LRRSCPPLRLFAGARWISPESALRTSFRALHLSEESLLAFDPEARVPHASHLRVGSVSQCPRFARIAPCHSERSAPFASPAVPARPPLSLRRIPPLSLRRIPPLSLRRIPPLSL